MCDLLIGHTATDRDRVRSSDDRVEDIDELETKIVIKARVVENLTLLLAQKRVDLQEAKKSTKSQAEAQVGAPV